MKYLYYVIASLAIAGLFYFAISRVDAGISWVRATYPHAKRCYPLGEQPKNIVHLSQPYPNFESCHSTLEQPYAE